MLLLLLLLLLPLLLLRLRRLLRPHADAQLSVTYVCKNLSYILLQTAAASLSFVQLAAHQVRT
jgi:hypothetical protein